MIPRGVFSYGLCFVLIQGLKRDWVGIDSWPWPETGASPVSLGKDAK